MLHKENFLLGSEELKSASLLMDNTLISTLRSPSADKAVILLLAAYMTLNVEYPNNYQQLLRALERLVTGRQQPSKYGRNQTKYDRFVALLAKK